MFFDGDDCSQLHSTTSAEQNVFSQLFFFSLELHIKVFKSINSNIHIDAFISKWEPSVDFLIMLIVHFFSEGADVNSNRISKN